MNQKELFTKAHKMAKEIKGEFPEIDYKFQLGLCLSYLQEEGENKMVQLKGSEKQVKWAEDIRKEVVSILEEVISNLEEVQKNNAARVWVKKTNFAKEYKEIICNSIKKATFFIDEYSYILKEKDNSSLKFDFGTLRKSNIDELKELIEKGRY